MKNMEIYEASRAVPEEAQKQFNNGSFSGTDINPMWRIKKLTELFGPCGVGWYYETLSERAETYGNTVMAIVDINLYIRVDGEWSKPIFGTGGNTLVKETKSGLRPSDEGYKMALTDALSVAAKALGIGADIYFGADKTKYSAKDEAPAITCEECMRTIVGVKTKDGPISASDVAQRTWKKYGRFLCHECAAKVAKAEAEAKAYANREEGE